MLQAESSPTPLPHDPAWQYRLRLGPHLARPDDRFQAQADWLWCQRADEVVGAGAIANQDALDAQRRRGERMALFEPNHRDEECAKLTVTDPADTGAIFDS